MPVNEVEQAKDSSDFFNTRYSLIVVLQGDALSGKWKDFYEIYWRVVYGYTRRFGLNHRDAEELVQIVLIKVVRKIAKYDPEKGRFRGWLKVITKNTVLNSIRRSKRVSFVPLDSENEWAVDMASLETKDGEIDTWDLEWKRAALAVALERVRPTVKPETYEIFVRYVLNEEPAKEVAASMGTTVNRVFKVKANMLRKIRAELPKISREL